jgi:D-alanyl-D-alanine carboxypeptidase/D-alanyl-D-alanine-endopeptidase (penicillin-binding protein 4)
VALPATLYDGSGLSTRDHLPASAVTAWLNALAMTPAGAPLRRGLPIACTNGTLTHRLCGPNVRGRVQAKTGSLDYSAALAGFAPTLGGRVVVFSVAVTGPPDYVDAKAIDAAVNQLVAGF